MFHRFLFHCLQKFRLAEFHARSLLTAERTFNKLNGVGFIDITAKPVPTTFFTPEQHR
jgi:hypothetical protein